jgi:hypothetical protein
MTEYSCRLIVLGQTFAICRLGSETALPGWAAADEFFSLTRTPEELSLVCRQDAVPDGVRHEPGWRCLRVAGTIDLGTVGVLASLTGPLARAGVSVFALSTFDTDYLLLKNEDLARACETLHRAGHEIAWE